MAAAPIYVAAAPIYVAAAPIYGWKAPGGTSLLWICHKNVFTLGPLLNSRKLQNAWVFFCLFNLGYWIDYIELDRLKGVPKKSKIVPTF